VICVGCTIDTGCLLYVHPFTCACIWWVQVIRANGTKVSMLRSTHADGRALPNALYASPLTLLPGDRLVTTCIYNTSGDTRDLVWGTARSNEMCLGTLYYYPAKSAGGCMNLQGRS
jgi:hypothetical protein